MSVDGVVDAVAVGREHGDARDAGQVDLGRREQIDDPDAFVKDIIVRGFLGRVHQHELAVHGEPADLLPAEADRGRLGQAGPAGRVTGIAEVGDLDAVAVTVAVGVRSVDGREGLERPPGLPVGEPIGIERVGRGLGDSGRISRVRVDQQMAVAAGAVLPLRVRALDPAPVAGLAVVEAGPGRGRILPDETPHVGIALVTRHRPATTPSPGRSRLEGSSPPGSGPPPQNEESDRSASDLHEFPPERRILTEPPPLASVPDRVSGPAKAARA